jgi:hypothetical protein
MSRQILCLWCHKKLTACWSITTQHLSSRQTKHYDEKRRRRREIRMLAKVIKRHTQRASELIKRRNKFLNTALLICHLSPEALISNWKNGNDQGRKKRRTHALIFVYTPESWTWIKEEACYLQGGSPKSAPPSATGFGAVENYYRHKIGSQRKSWIDLNSFAICFLLVPFKIGTCGFNSINARPACPQVSIWTE